MAKPNRTPRCASCECVVAPGKALCPECNQLAAYENAVKDGNELPGTRETIAFLTERRAERVVRTAGAY